MKSRTKDGTSNPTGIKTRELDIRIAEAKELATAAEHRADKARAEFKRLRKAFKQAKKAAKESRKHVKALKKELGQMKEAEAARAAAARKKPVVKSAGGRKAAKPKKPAKPRGSLPVGPESAGSEPAVAPAAEILPVPLEPPLNPAEPQSPDVPA